MSQLAAHIGVVISDARTSRHWTLRELADQAGISVSFLHSIEHGKKASLETYAAIADALDLQLILDLFDPRKRGRAGPAADPVHAAMGTSEASQLAAVGVHVALDEPYQHYQFAGRADLVASSADLTALLHIENRTRFPNIGETFGSYNAKRRYLPAAIAERLGVRGGFASVTNVVVALWSSEVLAEVRRHEASFRAVRPDSPKDFLGWLGGTTPASGVTSSFVLFDPVDRGRSDRRRVVPLDEIRSVRPRFAGYADAAEALRWSGQA
ncbi:MAG TPA: helix-turn-helix transcriptional regulator [Candidatus Limnocylindrales bacterium]|nr:helix-turn-helix transcriptional regulator [Candidatus Limnocylindrales bacterium]